MNELLIPTAFFLDELAFYLELAKWAVLFYMAYWLYQWVESKLGFSPVAVFAVSAILIYFLVIQHPIFGALGIFGYIVLAGGFLMIVQLVPPIWMMFRKR